jgi:CRP-like cAMP-binding protein
MRELHALGEPGHWRAGATVIEATAVVDSVFLVRTGEVRLLRMLAQRGAQRRPATVAVIRPGGIVGDIPILAGHEMAFEARATKDAVLVEVPRREFLALLARNPHLSVHWLRSVACRLEQIQRHVLMLIEKDLKQQVASLLLDAKVQRPDDTWVVPLAHRDIADLLGATRAAVSRRLRQLREEGLLRTGYGRIELVELERLRRAAGDRIGPPPCTRDGQLEPFLG